MPKHHILIMRDDRYWIVGPFADEAAAGDWGHAHAWGIGDADRGDPRWQVLTLEDATAAPLVLTPDAAVSVMAETV